MASTPGHARAQAAGKTARRVRLKPQDSFDLIRLIARSQADARKAIGELVQNSLDAGAAHVGITWFNEKGVRTLRIRDDGEGIFPGETREDALQKLAQTIGHSHKQSLSLAQRHEQMVLGKYGIGLLGFWCVARVMEITSRVGGGDAWMLKLEEDRPEAEVFRVRSQRSYGEETFTDITLRQVKSSVVRQVRPPRLQAYLASELRGQLLQRGVEVRIHDRVARGKAVKEFVVRPRAYLGLPLADLRVLEVTGYEDARLELYLVPADEGRHGTVSLACGGSTVLDDVAAVDLTDPSGTARPPWSTGRFEGVIDFPDLEIAPGTRRGFVPNEAALQLLLAIEKLERELERRLAQLETERAAQRHESLAREIRRAFAPVARRLPYYDLFDVRGRGTEADAASGVAGAEVSVVDEPETAGSSPEAAEPGTRDERKGGEEPEPPSSPSLFPPGPLYSVRIVPARLKLAPATERSLVARAVDADSRPACGVVTFTWRLEGPGTLTAEGARARYAAPADESEARIEVSASQDDRTATAEVSIVVQESAASGSERTAGIPEPEAVNAPSEAWRSRLSGDRWQYNEGHRDYRAVGDDEPRRLRYLIHLFAKEVVLKNFGAPQEEAILERMVEVLTHLGDSRGR